MVIKTFKGDTLTKTFANSCKRWPMFIETIANSCSLVVVNTPWILCQWPSPRLKYNKHQNKYWLTNSWQISNYYADSYCYCRWCILLINITTKGVMLSNTLWSFLIKITFHFEEEKIEMHTVSKSRFVLKLKNYKNWGRSFVIPLTLFNTPSCVHSRS